MTVEHPSALADLFAVFERVRAGEIVVLGAGESFEDPPPGAGLGLRTSGTTGRPRVAWHAWSDLVRSAVEKDGLRAWTWASPFRPDSYAGVQVALQAWLTGGRCLTLGGNWEEMWDGLGRVRPQALCCTPTFLDLLMLAEGDARAGWEPRQITLGGEPLRAATGQRARERFPHTRFTVVYAAAELGLIARTHRLDGWLEVDTLRERWDDWRVSDGVLELRRAGVWRATPDVVSVEGPLIRVLGRAGATANVGGTKVMLGEVEAAAEEVAGVLYARARAEASAVTGQVVALSYAPRPGEDESVVRGALERHLRERLRREAWPRVWECVVPGLGANAKKGGGGSPP